jgi:hypothetical protein
MRTIIACASWFIVVEFATQILGHGNPIQVNVADTRLTVAVGLALGSGYARFASDPHEDAALDFGPNQTLRSAYPGYNIAGLDSQSALQFEVVSRPDFTAPGFPTRWLWFWNAGTQTVSSVPADARFDVIPIFGSGSIQVKQSGILAGPTLTMASPIGPYLGADQHLLIYQLQNAPAAAPGVYGMFARLVSPGLEPSEPVLLAFRNAVDVDAFPIAANAINQAAALAGDYDDDVDVDLDDYNFWRARFENTVPAFTSPDGNGSGTVDTADYVVWRNAVGQAGASSRLSAVPEPTTLLICGLLTACAALFRRRDALPD